MFQTTKPAQQFELLQDLFGAWHQALFVFHNGELAKLTKVDERAPEVLTDEEMQAIRRAIATLRPETEAYWKRHDEWRRDRDDPWTNPTEELEAKAHLLPALLAALTTLVARPEPGPLTPGWILSIVAGETRDAYRRANELVRETIAAVEREVEDPTGAAEGDVDDANDEDAFPVGKQATLTALATYARELSAVGDEIDRSSSWDELPIEKLRRLRDHLEGLGNLFWHIENESPEGLGRLWPAFRAVHAGDLFIVPCLIAAATHAEAHPKGRPLNGSERTFQWVGWASVDLGERLGEWAEAQLAETRTALAAEKRKAEGEDDDASGAPLPLSLRQELVDCLLDVTRVTERVKRLPRSVAGVDLRRDAYLSLDSAEGAIAEVVGKLTAAAPADPGDA